tara:strand:- start:212 stop:1138 length:927 start_codon:yes stop_codon:yes gene_type:complete
MLNDIKDLILVSEEINKALNQKIPIVALESTIITHGMPFPDNYETAIKAEKIVRYAGCIPATIALINGQIKIGLTQNEIYYLSKTQSTKKLSTSDLAMGIVQKITGSTTVAATLILAALAKISVFATGGIGGVHRGFEKDFDISADLKQLASVPINVVCAGPKAILDLPKTIELIGSLGVPIITFRSQDIPAFWSRNSGLKSPIIAKSVKEIAHSYLVRSQLGLNESQLICNPIPIKNEIKRQIIEPAINQSIELAKIRQIKGQDVTPFLLSKINEATRGQSLEANKALLFNNIDLATKIANTLCKMQ